MKKFFVSALMLAFALSSVSAKDKKKTEDEGYVFTTVKELKITPVKNQNRTGTCWCFSTLGFLESELLRMGKGEYDLSEMFIVSKNYKDKAEKFVRLHGELNYAQGGSFEDVLQAWKDYGIVPESVMNGLQYGEDMHVHNELESASRAYLDQIIKNPNRKLSTAWKKGFDGIIDAYLGTAPEKFTYNGKEYTPKSFAAELGINPDELEAVPLMPEAPVVPEINIPETVTPTESQSSPAISTPTAPVKDVTPAATLVQELNPAQEVVTQPAQLPQEQAPVTESTPVETSTTPSDIDINSLLGLSNGTPSQETISQPEAREVTNIADTTQAMINNAEAAAETMPATAPVQSDFNLDNFLSNNQIDADPNAQPANAPVGQIQSFVGQPEPLDSLQPQTPTTSTFIEKEETPVAANDKKCPNCGAKLPLEAKFCYLCGKPL